VLCVGIKAAICELPFARKASDTEGGAGGTCVLRGCVPKKLMVFGGEFAEAFRDSVGFGCVPVAYTGVYRVQGFGTFSCWHEDGVPPRALEKAGHAGSMLPTLAVKEAHMHGQAWHGAVS
jgi:hypothetical protein